MDFLGKLCLINKAKSVISSLSGMVILWATGSPSPMQTPPIKGLIPTHQQYDDLQLIGLKTLICKHPKIHHQQILFRSHMASPSPPPKTTPRPPLKNTWSSSSLVLDDLIGTDSGVHIISSDDIGQTASTETNKKNKHLMSYYKDRIHDKRAILGRQFPPPISRLARGGGLAPGQSLPWVWTRSYRDGKLILQGHPLARHEYFVARRDDGRLILDLVSIENNTCNDHQQTRSRSCEDDRELIQFSMADYDHDEDDQNVAVFESLSEISNRSSLGAAKGLTYACGVFMDMHERSNCQASSSAPLVRPMTSVIM